MADLPVTASDLMLVFGFCKSLEVLIGREERLSAEALIPPSIYFLGNIKVLYLGSTICPP